MRNPPKDITITKKFYTKIKTDKMASNVLEEKALRDKCPTDCKQMTQCAKEWNAHPRLFTGGASFAPVRSR